jgi:RND family efflux transporter MFP subunit
MSRKLQIGLPFVFVLLGVGGAAFISSLAGDVDKAAGTPTPLAVQVVTVERASFAATVEATGVVQPATQVDLVAQVPGRVTRVADGLTPGKRFRKGDLIAAVDARDYEAAVVSARANVVTAELEVALEEGRAAQAERELDLLGKPADNPLTLRGPQLAAARARLDAAEASWGNAKVNLSRTRLVAPFDAVVSSESLDVGQYVGPGAPVARLMGTDRYRVRVSIPVHEMSLLDVPPLNAEQGSVARIRQSLIDGTVLEREGFVLRGLGELDSQTRTAGILVAIDDPLDPTAGMPILPGAYVDVTLVGKTTDDLVRVPRVAVSQGDRVWIATSDATLASRAVTAAWGDREFIYVADGLEEGDRVVVTPMALPIVGMPLDVRDAVALAE